MAAPLQPRAHRLDLRFPVRFHAAGESFAGECLNLSESGLLAVFDQPLELWTAGTLLLETQAGACQQPARVARCQDLDTGFAFLFTADAQRAAIRQLLTLAAHGTHLVGRPPF